jgi:hypothetical protein
MQKEALRQEGLDRVIIAATSYVTSGQTIKGSARVAHL